MKQKEIDAHPGISFENYLKVLELEEFKRVLEIPYKAWDKSELFQVYYHYANGILLKCSSSQNRVGSSTLYFNWQPQTKPSGYATNEASASLRYCSGGYFERSDKQWGWYGSVSGTDLLRYKIDQLRKYGEFISPWEKRPLLWLVDHEVEQAGEKCAADDFNKQSAYYDTITVARIALLPEEVQSRLGNG